MAFFSVWAPQNFFLCLCDPVHCWCRVYPNLLCSHNMQNILAILPPLQKSVGTRYLLSRKSKLPSIVIFIEKLACIIDLKCSIMNDKALESNNSHYSDTKKKKHLNFDHYFCIMTYLLWVSYVNGAASGSTVILSQSQRSSLTSFSEKFLLLKF